MSALLTRFLKAPGAAAAIQTLELGSLVTELANAQSAFEQAQQEKITVEAEKIKVVTRKKDARSIIIYRIECALNYLDAEIKDFPAKYTVLGKELNEAISEINRKAKMRRDRGTAGDPDIADETTGEPAAQA